MPSQTTPSKSRARIAGGVTTANSSVKWPHAQRAHPRRGVSFARDGVRRAGPNAGGRRPRPRDRVRPHDRPPRRVHADGVQQEPQPDDPGPGHRLFQEGGKLRWEYTEPTPQEIVSDGKKLWVYTPTLNQANVAQAPEALAGPAGSFLAGLGRLRTEFQVRFLNPAQPKDAEGNWVLDLTPKQPLPTLTRLILSVEGKNWEIRKAVVHDQFENTVTMRFTKMAVNSGLPD